MAQRSTKCSAANAKGQYKWGWRRGAHSRRISISRGKAKHCGQADNHGGEEAPSTWEMKSRIYSWLGPVIWAPPAERTEPCSQGDSVCAFAQHRAAPSPGETSPDLREQPLLMALWRAQRRSAASSFPITPGPKKPCLFMSCSFSCDYQLPCPLEPASSGHVCAVGGVICLPWRRGATPSQPAWVLGYLRSCCSWWGGYHRLA